MRCEEPKQKRLSRNGVCREALADGLPCGRETTGGKPYCIRHLGQLPYVAALKEVLEEREDELRRARRGLPLEAGSPLAEEIWEALQREGYFPLCFVPGEIALPQQDDPGSKRKVTRAIVNLLVRLGMATVEQLHRVEDVRDGDPNYERRLACLVPVESVRRYT